MKGGGQKNKLRTLGPAKRRTREKSENRRSAEVGLIGQVLQSEGVSHKESIRQRVAEVFEVGLQRKAIESALKARRLRSIDLTGA
jgi:hypothetical protein